MPPGKTLPFQEKSRLRQVPTPKTFENLLPQNPTPKPNPKTPPQTPHPMEPTPHQNAGFNLEGYPLKLEKAQPIALARGLTIPPGEGKICFFTCVKSGTPRVARASVWNAGRITHKLCCGRASTPEEHPKPVAPMQSVLLQHRPGLARASAVAKGHKPSGLFAEEVPHTPLTLRVTQLGIERLFQLPPEGVAWLKWAKQVDTDPLNCPPPPASPVAAQNLTEMIRATHKELQSFAWALARIDPALDIPHIHAGAHKPLGRAPLIIPRFTFGDPRHIKAFDWSTDPPTALSPLQVASLAVMLLEWSANAPSRPSQLDIESLRHTAVHDFSMAKPEAVRKREWFREIPATEGALKASPEALMPSQVLVALKDHTHLALIARPPRSQTLPVNWHEPLSAWDWENTGKYDVHWPETWMDLPEIF